MVASAFVHSLGLLLLAAAASAMPLTDDSAIESAFGHWAAQHERVFASPSERLERLALFAATKKIVDAHNADLTATFTMALNQFADRTEAEKKMVRGFRPDLAKPRAATPFTHAAVTPAASVDWRTTGKLTSVKNQGQCGSCWTFSATGSMESAIAIQNNSTWASDDTGYSEQQILECDLTSMGCGGGLMDHAFQHVVTNGGIDRDSDYPYQAHDGFCFHAKERFDKYAAITAFTDVPKEDAEALKQALTMQPVSVAIDAQCPSFMNYAGGVMTDDCGTQLDHGVLAVGYGVDATAGPYWIVKNSWGSAWGESGYIRMGMQKSKSGTCGILTAASYPTAGPTPTPAPVPSNPCVVGSKYWTCPNVSTCCCTKTTIFKHKCETYQCCIDGETTCDTQSHKGGCVKI